MLGQAEVALEQAVGLDRCRRGGPAAAAPGARAASEEIERALSTSALALRQPPAGDDHQHGRDRHPERGKDRDDGAKGPGAVIGQGHRQRKRAAPCGTALFSSTSPNVRDQ